MADPAQAGCIGVARLGSVQLENGGFSIWVQVRGSSWVEAREGRFQLQRGEWIALERDSRPLVQSDRHGLCIGLSLGSDILRTLGRLSDGTLYAGRGSLSRHDLRVALRLWRDTAGRMPATDLGQLRPLLLHLVGVQRELAARVPRCPGRSRTRKRQVFGRLQRARLYLEGNSDRIVRISELAELTSFSSWYFSKTFLSLYDESPQAAAARLRIERAAELLDSTSMMIGEVAAACGFDNCCSFARAFRARFGVSASRYRQGMRALPEAANTPIAPRRGGLRTGT
ncbi:helix-turn-helix domain-containing protein [Lysobacter solisilvae (ex Woo and Kim 2020)]|uniref:Helix-turn-helix transcriptional regulator n=1 Tax=Agrilutibacter terrestris TaxID=2865112 RepID=A0A7H0G1D1_9GAMM|nr:helix-turn-helix transcriptional regulator [Lysobacter terrestris]